MFWKKKSDYIELIDFDGNHISTAQVGSYIKNLYAENKFMHHIGYRHEKRKGMLRFILYTLAYDGNPAPQYFKDRCPAMVEDAVQKTKIVPFSTITFEGNLLEVEEISITFSPPERFK